MSNKENNQPFDRAAHCRRIASRGGRTTVARYGSSHMSAIGVRGFLTVARRYFSDVDGYKVYLRRIGGWTYAASVRPPGWERKFGSEKPLGPWDPDYTEF